MKPSINPSLWKRIEAFSIDDPSAGIKFSGKLAAQNGWTPSFAARAVAEYKKFIFLCCISPTGASPSKVVDEVWHLHLTYTHNYWKEFCGGVLQQEIHHHPSKGGPAEGIKHRSWYAETLMIYKRVFEDDPPADVWPPPATGTTSEAKANDPPERNYTAAYKKDGYVLALPFLFPPLCGSLHPFALKGPQFLSFYALLLAATVVYLALVRKRKAVLIQETVNGTNITNANSFELARYVFGKAKAVEAAIVDLVAKGILIAERGDRFSFYPDKVDATTCSENPLAANLLRHCSGNQTLAMKNMAAHYDEDLSNHTELARMYQTVAKKDRGGYVTGALVFLFGLVRTVQGLHNGYPVAYLRVMMMAGLFVLLVMAAGFSSKNMLREIFTKRYREKAFGYPGQEALLHKFIFLGVAALAGTYAFANLERTFKRHAAPSGGDGGSGCGGSCGSSCGSGCGGGCGGCGGGD